MTSLKYKNEHLSCGYYQKDRGAMIEIMNLEKGKELRKEISEPKIIFIKQGRARISYQKILGQKVRAGQIILLPPISDILANIEEDSLILIFRLDSTTNLCNTYSLNNLYEDCGKSYDSDHILIAKDKLIKYTDLLIECIHDGIRCSNFFKIKISELLYYFRLYYTKNELNKFFSPILTNDSSFANFVFKNYNNAKNVQELSALYGYSQSSFEKQFKKTFGVSAYQWMIDKKAKQIYHQLTCYDKNFAEIANDFDFSSPSQFCDFCKHFLGASPKEIRQKRVCGV